MQNRIKAARKALGLTQTEFGARLGLKGNTVTGYETGLRCPSEATITSICREFQVSEKWLRTGEGEMFARLSEDEELAGFFGRVALTEEASFRKRLLRSLSRLSDDEWALLEKLLRDIVR